jgi:hypothetical protein
MQEEWLNNRSRVMGDYHARFCESLMGRFHWATRRVVIGENPKLLRKLQKDIELFLLSRGLELSKEKTHITHIRDGFDFLGFNLSWV